MSTISLPRGGYETITFLGTDGGAINGPLFSDNFVDAVQTHTDEVARCLTP